MPDTFPAQNHLSPIVGLIPTRDPRPATGRRIYLSRQENGDVSVAGIWNCPLADYRLAMLEMKMALATFILSFDAKLKNPDSDPPYFYDRYLIEKGPLEVIIYPRQV
jgi:hypothetical protein